MSDVEDERPYRALVLCLLICFVATWCVGEALIFHGNRHADRAPGLSVMDLQEKFTGGHGSLLEAQVQGAMRQYLDSAAEVALLTAWAQLGASEVRYRQDVAALIEERCVRCHRRGGQAAFRPLTTYAEARATALAPPAPPVAQQMLVTKVHVVGIGLILAATSFFFIRFVPRQHRLGGSRTFIICLAFFGLAADFSSWWLMRWDLNFAWGRVVGNVSMSFAFLLMVLATMNSLFPWKTSET